MQPVTPARYRERRWSRYRDYRFAAKDVLAPLVLQELPKAVMSLPVGFVFQSGNYSLVAVQGWQPGKNLLVGTGGRWLRGYVPAVYRGYPFALVKVEGGQQVLCFDEASGLLLEDPSPNEGEPFFDIDEQPAEPVRQIIEFLRQVATDRKRTTKLCALLAEHELIQPWPLTLDAGDGNQAIEGLYRVDEKALNALPADALARVRAAGALPLIYCQLLSMQHMDAMSALAAQQTQSKPALDTGGFFGEQETLSFNWDQ